MASKLGVVVVVIAFDGRIFDRAVHALDLPVGPGMFDLGEPVLDAIFAAAHVEHVGEVGRGRAVPVAWREGELDSVVGQNRMNPVWHGGDQRFEESRCGLSVRLFDEQSEREFARAVNGDEEMELSLAGMYLGDVDVEVADGVALEALFRRLVALDIRQAADAMALKASMQ